MHMFFLRSLIMFFILTLCACEQSENTSSTTIAAGPTVAEAVEFVAQAEQQLTELGLEAGRMDWVYSNFITEDTEKLAAQANMKYTQLQVVLASGASRFKDVEGLDKDEQAEVLLFP